MENLAAASSLSHVHKTFPPPSVSGHISAQSSRAEVNTHGDGSSPGHGNAGSNEQEQHAGVTTAEALGCGLRYIFARQEVLFEHLFAGRLIVASILPFVICLLCSMLIERTIDRNRPYQTDLYHIYLPH